MHGNRAVVLVALRAPVLAGLAPVALVVLVQDRAAVLVREVLPAVLQEALAALPAAPAPVVPAAQVRGLQEVPVVLQVARVRVAVAVRAVAKRLSKRAVWMVMMCR